MLCLISAGVGPSAGPLLAVMTRRCGGLARSWGARLACLTRRGSPLMSPFSPGCDSGSIPPGTAVSGPVWRESSHGGLDGLAVGSGVAGVAWLAAFPPPPRPDETLVQPGNGAGSSG
jgi:hypothetical protein